MIGRGKMQSLIFLRKKGPTSTGPYSNLHVNISVKLIFVVSVILNCSFIFPSASAQEYLSLCNSTNSCSPQKFLSCISGQCQCQDVLNQEYDNILNSCVLMAGRRCGETSEFSNSDEFMELDPRRLRVPESPKPSCGSNAFCNVATTSTCECKKGSFHNETSGRCELSLGKQCDPTKGALVIVFNKGLNSTSSEQNSCESSLGLTCTSDGICTCQDNAVWKIDQGCVVVQEGNAQDNNEGSTTTEVEISPAPGNSNFQNLYPTQYGNYYSPENYYYQEEPNPFQQFINEYTNALIQAEYLAAQNAQNGKGTMDSQNSKNTNNATNSVKEFMDDMIVSPSGMKVDGVKTNSLPPWVTPANNKTANKSNNNYFIGDRNQFPGGTSVGNVETGNGLNSNNNADIAVWNLLQQQFQQQQINNFSQNNYGPLYGNGGNDLNRLQEQAAQLQKLLLQQQQLQQVINEIQAMDNPKKQRPLKQSSIPNLPPLIAPLNNQLGDGHVRNPTQHLYNGHQQSHYNYINQNQQQFAPLFQNSLNQYQPLTPTLGPFSFLRFFRNTIDSFKRRLFPNLAETVSSFPSPLYIAASTVYNLLPVLRAFDQQFSPVLENVIQLTKPRQRPQIFPAVLHNLGFLNQQSVPQTQYSGPPTRGQHQFPINGNNNNIIFPGQGRSIKVGGGAAVGKPSNNKNQQEGNTRNKNFGRRLWWW